MTCAPPKLHAAWFQSIQTVRGIREQFLNGKAATHANGGTIGFACDSPEKVKAFHDAGVASGGKSIEDPPGWREGAAGKLYLAYLRDPSGNKICALHRPT
jgi:catechol 2,3-dioxygenase-like lactoylglutathione lyase family enzyme